MITSQTNQSTNWMACFFNYFYGIQKPENLNGASPRKNNWKQPSKKHMVNDPAQARVENLCLYEQKGLINLHGQ